MTKPAGEYVVTYDVKVYAYIDMDDDPPSVTKVVVDDENISAPMKVERIRRGDLTEIDKATEEATEVLNEVDGPDADWPGWEFGF